MSFGHLLECSLVRDFRGPLHYVDWTFNTRLSAIKMFSNQCHVPRIYVHLSLQFYLLQCTSLNILVSNRTE